MNTTPMRGFTLVETLVAITVVVTAMVGPLYAVQQSLNASRTAREQLIASSLAQEGVEYVRSIRDNNYLFVLRTSSPRSWLFGLDGTGGSVDCISATCVIDPTQNTVSRTVGPLYLSSTNLYNQASSGTITKYTRTVQLTPVSSTEMTLTVIVTWTSKNQTRNVTITERLHNWL
jgi:prepilin-type N-terminal cleavage/methylation domain-containing protein